MSDRPAWSDPGQQPFPPGDRAAWEVAAGGAAALEKLTRATDEGLRLRPLYDRSDWPDADVVGFPGQRPWTRGLRPPSPRAWEVLGEHADPERDAGAAAVRADLEGGADGVHLRLDAIAPRSAEHFDALLGKADLSRWVVSLEPGGEVDAALSLLLSALQRRKADPACVRATLGADPGAALLRPAGGHEALRGRLATWAGGARGWPGIRIARSSGAPWHEAGADAALELGLVLAGALDSLRALVEGGVELLRAARSVELLVSLDADLYRSVAKLRALRRGWGRALEALGLEPAECDARIVARTSERMLSRRDPWTNALRATLAATAAATGGAEALIVLPFDQALGAPSERARRLARNTQLVLREEARLHQVMDPWGGSYAMERLSDELARAAWGRLQELERLGGPAAAHRAGWIQERIAATTAAREKRVARRQDALVGVSDWPLPGELPPGSLLTAPAASPGPLAPRRVAEPWEALWLRSAAHAAKTGAPPRVALIALGPLAEHLTRSTWIANLLAAAGIEAPPQEQDGACDAAGAVAALGGARVAVLCGPDARYAELTESVAPALRSAGAARVLQAGAPGEREAAFRAAGVDEFLSAGSDVLAACQRLLAALGVADRGGASASGRGP